MPVHSSQTVTAPHLRSRATQDEILLAFADRLRDHELLNEQNVVVSDQSVPSQMPGGGFCVCVSAGPGEFPSELWNAASHAQATEDGSVIVGVYTKITRDRRGRSEIALFGRRKQTERDLNVQRPGLIVWKRDLLKLLTVGQDRQAWEPASAAGAPLCRDIPTPKRVTGVLDVPGFPGWIGLQITIAVTWDWELYA